MNTNTSFTGIKASNPFHYRKFGLREVKITRGNQTLVLLDTTHDSRSYVTTMKSLKFFEDGPDIKLSDFPNHYVLVFDLTSTQEAHVQMMYPDVAAASIRLELTFSAALANTTELIVQGERLSTVYIDRERSVSKNGQ